MMATKRAKRPDQPKSNETLEQATACAKSGDFEAAIHHLKELLSADPKHEIATGLLASVYAELKMIDRAMEYFQRVLEINSENALARFQLGVLQLDAGRPRDALDTWKPSLKNPDDFAAHYYSGAALLRLDQAEEARPLLEEAARRMPKDHALYPHLQNLLRHLTG